MQLVNKSFRGLKEFKPFICALPFSRAKRVRKVSFLS